MQNVIAFPKQAKPAPVEAAERGAKTLFLHIRRTTLIVHLAGSRTARASGSRVGRQS